MSAGRRDLDGALGGFLAFDVAQVRRAQRVVGEPCSGTRQDLRALDVIDERDQRRRGDDLQIAGPGRFRPAGSGTDEAARLFGGGYRRRQNTGDRGDLRVERKLAKRDIVRHLTGRQHTHRRQQAERDGKIVVAAFLRQIGRREVHGDALVWQRKPDGGQRGTHALLAFAHRFVAKANDVEQPAAALADMDLHVHLARLDALERDGVDVRDRHAALPPASS